MTGHQANYSVASSLYWSLPGPKGFVYRLGQRAREHRATALSFTRHLIPGMWDSVRDGLYLADIHKVIKISIHDGMDVAAEVGPHFGRDFLIPAHLAEYTTGVTTAILLIPNGVAARQKCDEYFSGFLQAIEHAKGNTHLFIELQDDAWQEDCSDGNIQVLAFDGALYPDEMSAYVGLRMLGRTGPGSTKLLRSLVLEYSGFDVTLAEQLMSLSDDEILRLPDCLGMILERDPVRWSSDSWLNGTHALVKGCKLRHPLHEWHLTLHSGPKQEEAKIASRKRYWRACVQTLTPWLEERRLQVLDIFRSPLDKLLAPTGGKLRRPLPNGKAIEIERNDIEYNSIVGLVHQGELVIPNDPASQQAFAVCKVAKFVRDDLAHLRAPNSQDILSLITTMDSLIS